MTAGLGGSPNEGARTRPLAGEKIPAFPLQQIPDSAAVRILCPPRPIFRSDDPPAPVGGSQGTRPSRTRDAAERRSAAGAIACSADIRRLCSGGSLGPSLRDALSSSSSSSRRRRAAAIGLPAPPVRGGKLPRGSGGVPFPPAALLVMDEGREIRRRGSSQRPPEEYSLASSYWVALARRAYARRHGR